MRGARALLALSFCLSGASLAMTVAAIWTGDLRWAATAAVVGLSAFWGLLASRARRLNAEEAPQ